ncbi:hypothetical protein Tsubulata_042768, partial [Turnera subulata]
MLLLPSAYWRLLLRVWHFPFILCNDMGRRLSYRTSKSRPVIDPSKPLPPQATFRGPYINTGSR